MSKYVYPYRLMLESISKEPTKIFRPLWLASLVSNRVPKEVKPLDLPDELPEEGMELDKVSELFQEQFLTSYFGEDIKEDLTEEELQQRINEYTTENPNKDAPESSLPTMLGSGLAVIG
eukprot:CAMPEP_0168332262 /NCGR_PEP_ID=MMETSP0213-20121227/8854_1 /TAXON_ID=151035 /ORGANISM="Euplotes harpa, Strain FSP1.4" /LENGTH=118 /DNA_ID=CAMNT_0008336255 /DNA_START=17 /DNA_END=373 /DNA_ORIENTATION=+